MLEQPRGPGASTYRPHLDGMRAVAVYLVVVFHAGVEGLSGGFIGVDVFFVLSGYLVTRLLLRDVEGRRGRIAFTRFYARRARRLLPAAGVTLVVTAVVYSAIAAPVELPNALDGIRAAALYVSNWFFIDQSSDYFAADIETNPVVHFWSLSVEEQFYLLWPLVFGALYNVASRFTTARLTVVRAVVVVAGLASMAQALRLSTDQLNRAYLGTDTRAYQLLAGAAIALSPDLVRRIGRGRSGRVVGTLALPALAGLLVLASSLIDTDPVRRGVATTVVTMVLLVSLETRTGAIRRCLSWEPLTYLGRISYGTYLWHWLLIIVLVRETELASGAIAAIVAVAATAVAAVSYRALEQPIRRSRWLDHRRPQVIATALAGSLAIGLLAAPLILTDRDSDSDRDRGDASDLAFVSSERVTHRQIKAAYADFYQYPDCEVSGPVACPLTESGDRTAIVVGESHAGMLTPMLTDLAERRDLRLYGGYLSYCPWTRGLRYARLGPSCFEDQERLFDEIIPALDPDIVFLAHRPVDAVNGSFDMVDADRARYPGGSDEQAAALEEHVSALVDDLREQGRTVVMFEPIPVVGEEDNTLTCLSAELDTEPCEFETSEGPTAEEQVMRGLAADAPEVVTVDLDRLVCPRLPTCDPVVRGRIVKRDSTHLTIAFATSLLDDVDAILSAEGVYR